MLEVLQEYCVEVVLLPSCRLLQSEIQAIVQKLVEDSALVLDKLLEGGQFGEEVGSWLHSIRISSHGKNEGAYCRLNEGRYELCVARLSADGPLDHSDEAVLEDGQAHYQSWNLPALQFITLWDSLVYEDDKMEQLLSVVMTGLEFSIAGVDPHLIPLNKLIYLYGPPGTGKTSLCKALSQKLSIRLASRFTSGVRLIEINSHSLFSKYFSESGKMVQGLFQSMLDMAEDSNLLLLILIDEVESLTSARKNALNGNEPTDSIRVVNAVLTQLDKLRLTRNVYVLATSNLTDALDAAFLDRSDIMLRVGQPGPRAIYAILASCLDELANRGLIQSATLLSEKMVHLLPDDGADPSFDLLSLSNTLQGRSGRYIRKIPFLAYVSLANKRGGMFSKCELLSVSEFIGSMRRYIQRGEDSHRRPSTLES